MGEMFHSMGKMLKKVELPQLVSCYIVALIENFLEESTVISKTMCHGFIHL
jgi:hypothetical protein